MAYDRYKKFILIGKNHEKPGNDPMEIVRFIIRLEKVIKASTKWINKNLNRKIYLFSNDFWESLCTIFETFLILNNTTIIYEKPFNISNRNEMGDW